MRNADLVQTNRQRCRFESEYELIDTGVFDDDRYFDVFVEYAKAGPEDTAIRISAVNHGPEAATLYVLPTLWFRNTWSWERPTRRPELRGSRSGTMSIITATHPEIGAYDLYCGGASELLFTENETNFERIFQTRNPSPYVKDGIDNYVVHGIPTTVNPAQTGTKACALYRITVPAGSTTTIDLRLSKSGASAGNADIAGILAQRKREADDFYAAVIPQAAPDDDRLIMRQALSSQLWTKQYYYFDLDEWLQEPRGPAKLKGLRNAQWFHMLNDDVISMPDKWEYPWYAAWDLAFHTVPLSMVDIDFAKNQLMSWAPWWNRRTPALGPGYIRPQRAW
jgi:hypothetical protein